jgi:hypothetical protein
MKIVPKEEDLDLVFVLDRSGSMRGSEEDTIGGFNSFIEKERAKGLNTRVTTVLFDDMYEMLYKRKSIDDVGELTSDEYWVRGCTALLDAIGRTINALDKEIKNKVLFVIMTDGLENASREFSKSQISSLIKEHDWEFIYIGADIDSYSEAGHIGIKRTHIANYKKTRRGFDEAFESIGNVSYCLRNDIEVDKSNWKEKLSKYD